ncbi:pentapeptide repeat-containing protein [Lachnospiraceae bacterium OttesenSCG-928-D06]|nr:pentapeptide repeat-containing protein [Lachnospiraceae bacterium OttesenSCG-928-D06]
MDILDILKKYKEYNEGKSKELIELLIEDQFFTELDFSDLDINYGKLLETTFEKCNFTDVYMSGASLCGSSFKNCIFSKNMFQKGRADYAYFFNTDLNYFDGFRASFYETEFENLRINISLLKSCHLSNTMFKKVLFINTDLSDTNFSNANFENVKFIKCHFENTIFKNNKGMDKLTFENVDLQLGSDLKKGIGNEIIRYFQ